MYFQVLVPPYDAEPPLMTTQEKVPFLQYASGMSHSHVWFCRTGIGHHKLPAWYPGDARYSAGDIDGANALLCLRAVPPREVQLCQRSDTIRPNRVWPLPVGSYSEMDDNQDLGQILQVSGFPLRAIDTHQRQSALLV